MPDKIVNIAALRGVNHRTRVLFRLLTQRFQDAFPTLPLLVETREFHADAAQREPNDLIWRFRVKHITRETEHALVLMWFNVEERLPYFSLRFEQRSAAPESAEEAAVLARFDFVYTFLAEYSDYLQHAAGAIVHVALGYFHHQAVPAEFDAGPGFQAMPHAA